MRYIVLIFTVFLIYNDAKSQATYTSSNSGNWNSSSAWTLTSGNDDDLNGYPDSNDDVIITNGFTITLTQTETVKNLNVNAGGTLASAGRTIGVRGTNITNDGSITGSIRMSWVNANPCTLSTSTNIDIRYLNLTNNTNLTYTASGGNLSILQFDIRSGSTFNNFGNLSVSSLSNQNSSNNFLNNHPGSSFSVATTIPSSGFTITNSNGSTFTYTSAASIFNTSYHHLNFSGANTKTASSNLNINGNLSISSGTLSLGNNTISVTGNLTNSGTISSSGTINVGGALTFSGSGNLASNNTSTIVMNGSSAQTITNSTSSTIPFYNLTCSNNAGVSLSSGSYTLKNNLTISSGTLNVGSNILTMLSDNSSTAVIGNSSGSISGSMNFQRFIPSGAKRYYGLGSTVTNLTIDAWDDDLVMSIGVADNNSTPLFLGGDGPTGNQKSVLVYNNQLTSKNKYEGIFTGTTLTPGKGYAVWFEDTAGWFAQGLGRALDFSGTPNMGSIPVSLSYKSTAPVDGYNLISNPYQAYIDWSLVTKTNLSTTIYYLKPGGAFSSSNGSSIAPGQGFFCQATGDSPSLTIEEADKINSSSAIQRIKEEVKFDLQLRLSSMIHPYYQEIQLLFDKKTKELFDENKDIPYLKSILEDVPSITFCEGEKRFIKNYFNSDIESAVFPLSIETPIAGNYIIDLDGLIENGYYESAYLFNVNTNEKYELKPGKSVTIYFDNSTIHNQYRLVLNKTDESKNEIVSSKADDISSFVTSDYIVIGNKSEITKKIEVKLFNVLGQLILSSTQFIDSMQEARIPIHQLKSELYVLHIDSGETQNAKKIVITK